MNSRNGSARIGGRGRRIEWRTCVIARCSAAAAEISASSLPISIPARSLLHTYQEDAIGRKSAGTTCGGGELITQFSEEKRGPISPQEPRGNLRGRGRNRHHPPA